MLLLGALCLSVCITLQLSSVQKALADHIVCPCTYMAPLVLMFFFVHSGNSKYLFKKIFFCCILLASSSFQLTACNMTIKDISLLES